MQTVTSKGTSVVSLSMSMGLTLACARAVARWAVGALIPSAGTALVAFLVIAASGITTGNAVANLDPDQAANARVIAEVAVHRRLGVQGVLLVEVVAFTESALRNVQHGDLAGPSSRGLFQQMPSWGPDSVRMDPAGSAGLFIDRLMSVSGWQVMPPWIAAQTVQGSEFDGKHVRNGKMPGFGDNYKADLQIAAAITAQLTKAADPGAPAQATQGCDPGASPGAPGAPGAVSVNGVDVALPSGPTTDPAAAPMAAGPIKDVRGSPRYRTAAGASSDSTARG